MKKLGYKLTSDILNSCFDLAVDENEEFFQRTNNNWDVYKVQMLCEVLIEFAPKSQRSTLSIQFINKVNEKDAKATYFNIKDKFVKEIQNNG
ncbi:MAG: hypothetical protein HC932_05275 [Thermales bacterium]|nr:hypothetical protein [Thermales bacterium]